MDVYKRMIFRTSNARIRQYVHCALRLMLFCGFIQLPLVIAGQNKTETELSNHPSNRFSVSPLRAGKEFYRVDVIARQGQVSELEQSLIELGLKQAETYNNVISGKLPASAIPHLESLESLADIKPGTVIFNSGPVKGQGDKALRADLARDAFGVTGVDVTIGVISDSFDCLGGAAADVASGDLPASAYALEDATDCDELEDEGRALMQIIHDIAPNAKLVFHSVFPARRNFAGDSVYC